MNETMIKALTKLFDRYRIVFWYCDDPMLAMDYDALHLDEVEKRDITGRAFAAKVEVVHERPRDKFLLFVRGPRPVDDENFLLDLLLANVEFHTDKPSLLAADLGLGVEMVPFLRETQGFFAVARRMTALKSAIDPKVETVVSLRRKMLGIAAGCAGGAVEHVLMTLLKDEEGETLKTFDRCGLKGALWDEVRAAYGYAAANPDPWDFALAAFRETAASVTGEQTNTGLATTIFAFLSDWRDHAKYADSFERLSSKAEKAIGVRKQFASVKWNEFGAADWFAAIDRRIVDEMAEGIKARTIRHEDVVRVVAERRNTHWFGRYSGLYLGLEAASAFLSELVQTEFQPATADEAVRSYAESWSRLDGHYRTFTAFAHETRKSDETLAALAEIMDGNYVNNCLVRMNTAFQKTLDGLNRWPFETSLPLQVNFWRDFVSGPMANKKVCVIISDALRYGVARTLAERIRATDRYSAKLEPMVGALPSYTQLGMAALLPHERIRFGIPCDGRVLVDDKPSSGLADRQAILAAAEPKGAEAVKAEDVLGWTKEQILEHQRANRVIYVYHNVIDATGDARVSESQTCEACEKAVGEILALVKKLAGPSHVSNFYITSDHGFLYQDREVEECDFIAQPTTSDVGGTFKVSRRFFIGHSAITRSELMRFEERDLGLTGDALVVIPKSITKMRLAGAGSRYVHGGASLQEITIPLITVSKSRVEDTAQVEIDILREGVNKITTGQLVVKLYQMTPVGGKNLERTVRLGIRTKDGRQLLSAQKEVVFKYDSASSADRIETVQLPLNHLADGLDGEQVQLVMESRVGGTSQYVPYKTETYLLKRSIVKDFD